jgi:hypothetical protein
MERINQPDLTDILNGTASDLAYKLNCHKIGIIQSFDPDEQTASVELVDKGVISSVEGEQLIPYPLLVDCPVVISKGAFGGLTIPVNEGDTCIVHFNDRDLDNWLIDGLAQRPNTLRTHHLSDAIVEIGVRNQINKITNYNNLATEVNYLDNLISIDATTISFINSAGGSIKIDDKLELKNSAENLKDIIDEFITIVTNLKTVDPVSGLLPIDGATASSLSALSTKVGDLLK